MTEPRETAPHRPDTPETRVAAHAASEDRPAKGRKLVAIIGGAALVLLVVAVVIATTLTRKPSEAAPPVVETIPDAPFTPTDTPPTPTPSGTPAPPPSPTVTPVAVPKLGDCVKPVPQQTGGPKYEKTSCDTKGTFLFQVAKIGQGAVECPQTDTRPYSVTMLRAKAGEPAGYLCLAMRLQKDTCYSFASGNTVLKCDDPAAQVRVTQVLATGDVKQCKPKGVAYPELKVAYCLEDVKKG